MSNLFAQCTLDMRLKPSSIYKEQPLDISDLEECHDDISGFESSCSEFLSSIFTNQVLTHMSAMALNLALYGKLNSLIRDVKLQMPLRVPGKGEKFADLVITVNEETEEESSGYGVYLRSYIYYHCNYCYSFMSVGILY